MNPAFPSLPLTYEYDVKWVVPCSLSLHTSSLSSFPCQISNVLSTGIVDRNTCSPVVYPSACAWRSKTRMVAGAARRMNTVKAKCQMGTGADYLMIWIGWLYPCHTVSESHSASRPPVINRPRKPVTDCMSNISHCWVTVTRKKPGPAKDLRNFTPILYKEYTCTDTAFVLG